MSTPADPHLPRYHFQGRPWMNDPIPFYHDIGGGAGDWHVFYQHNPLRPHWGDMCWGHALTRDLVHWQTLPIALAPTPGLHDQRGCWTGSLLQAQGGFYLFYTAIPSFKPELKQVQALATSQDLNYWTKHPSPLIHGKPKVSHGGGAHTCFRDPCVFPEGAGYTMIVGSEKADGSGGLALRYTSPDLLVWSFANVLCEGRNTESGFDFECPDFFPLESRHVLLTSRHRQWGHLGTYDIEKGTFQADSVTALETESFYAGKTAADGKGRRLLFGWIMEAPIGSPEDPAVIARGWAGVLSLPRELYLTAAGRIGQRPPKELEALRHRHLQQPPLALDSGTTYLEQVQGDALELHLRVRLASARTLKLHLRADPETAESFPITYDRESHTLQGVPCPEPATDTLDICVFIDRSVIEAFAHGAAATRRSYAKRPQAATKIGIECDADVQVEILESWEAAT